MVSWKQQQSEDIKNALTYCTIPIAIRRRAQEKNKPKDTMQQYYAVIGFFILCMVGAALYTFMNPQ